MLDQVSRYSSRVDLILSIDSELITFGFAKQKFFNEKFYQFTFNDVDENLAVGIDETVDDMEVRKRFCHWFHSFPSHAFSVENQESGGSCVDEFQLVDHRLFFPNSL